MSNDPDSVALIVDDCPTCDGYGTAVEDGVLDICPTCDGDGVVTE